MPGAGAFKMRIAVFDGKRAVKRLQPLKIAPASAHHQTRAVPRAFWSAGDPDIRETDSGALNFFSAGPGIFKKRIAPVYNGIGAAQIMQ